VLGVGIALVDEHAPEQLNLSSVRLTIAVCAPAVAATPNINAAAADITSDLIAPSFDGEHSRVAASVRRPTLKLLTRLKRDLSTTGGNRGRNTDFPAPTTPSFATTPTTGVSPSRERSSSSRIRLAQISSRFSYGALGSDVLAVAARAADFVYTFSGTGTLEEAGSMNESASPDFWLSSGATRLDVQRPRSDIAGRANRNPTRGACDTLNPTRKTRTAAFIRRTSSGSSTVTRGRIRGRVSTSPSRRRTSAHRRPQRDQRHLPLHPLLDQNNLYDAGLRADGQLVIKKKIAGVYSTLAVAPLFSGTTIASRTRT